jgi:hypothetical protein
MNGKANLATLVLSAIVSVSAALAEVQIPPGFEIVQITDDDDYDGPPRINNCGQIVWSKRINQDFDQEEIFVWDNGIIVQITDDDVRDAFPDINDEGMIVWSRKVDGVFEIAVYENGEIAMLTANGLGAWGPRVNNLGHVAWHERTGGPCAESNVFLYDGIQVRQITDGLFSHQGAAINDNDEIAWTRYDFCSSPWRSTIMLYAQDALTELTDGNGTDQVPDINNVPQVAWTLGENQGIAVWENGSTHTFTDWGGGPQLANSGDMTFWRWHAEHSVYQQWLWWRGQLFQLTDSSVHDADGRINDRGEVAWMSGDYPGFDILLLKAAAGDVDGDGLVTALDFGLLADSMTGPIDAASWCLAPLMGIDEDVDGDIDLADFVLLQRSTADLDKLAEFVPCMTGPLRCIDRCWFRLIDFDQDRDVDLKDYAAFERSVSLAR